MDNRGKQVPTRNDARNFVKVDPKPENQIAKADVTSEEVAASQVATPTAQEADAPAPARAVQPPPGSPQATRPQPFSGRGLAGKLHKLRDELRDVRKASNALVDDVIGDPVAIQTGVAQLVKQFASNLTDIEMAATDIATRIQASEEQRQR